LRGPALSYILLLFTNFLHKQFDKQGVLELEYARLKLRPEHDAPLGRSNQE